MTRTIFVLVLVFAGAAKADPLEGIFELTKINDKAAADLLHLPDTIYARYLFLLSPGKVTARMQTVSKTADADKFISCEAAAGYAIKWQGDSFTIPDDITAEGQSTILVRSKEADKNKVSTDRRTCTVFLKKGTYKAGQTK